MAKGVMAIITWPDGKVLASHADFERQGPGGLSIEEAQKYRARTFVKWQAFKALCHPDVVKAMESYDIEKAVDTMISKGGFKLTCIEVSTEKQKSEEAAHG